MLCMLISALAMLCLFASVAAALQATVTWTDGAAETGYKVQRQDAGGAWVDQVTTAANVTSFNQTLPTVGIQYCYRIVATNAFGDAPASNPACGTPASADQVGGVTVVFSP